MNHTLLSAGLARLVAGILGGGLKAFGLEIPLVTSRTRQVKLGSVGLLIISVAIAVKVESRAVENRNSDTTRSHPKTVGHRTQFCSYPKLITEIGAIGHHLGGFKCHKRDPTTTVHFVRAFDVRPGAGNCCIRSG